MDTTQGFQMNNGVPILVIYRGALAGTRYTLDRAVVAIGRAADCDIVIPERQVSRYHARVEQDEHGYILRDLGSSNGTFVNNDNVMGQSYRLRDGDEISLAHVVEMGFICGDATLPLDDFVEANTGWVVDEGARRVSHGRYELDPPLSPAQFSLMALLYDNQGKVITRADVIERVWPDAAGGVTDQAVDALVYRLRERLAELDPSQTYIHTIRGHGYRFGDE